MAGAAPVVRAAGAVPVVRAVGAVPAAVGAVGAAAIVAGVMRVLLKMKVGAAIGADVLLAPRQLHVHRAAWRVRQPPCVHRCARRARLRYR